jgi:hypothetical protein
MLGVDEGRNCGNGQKHSEAVFYEKWHITTFSPSKQQGGI